MEKIFSTSQFSWGHEKTPGHRMAQPSEEDMMELERPDGSIVRSPRPGWKPEIEEVELETIIIVEGDPQDSVVFKISFDKEHLAAFLAHFVQYLDIEGRQVVREELSKASDIVIPTPQLSKAALKLVE